MAKPICRYDEGLSFLRCASDMRKVLTVILFLAALSQSFLARAEVASAGYLCIGTEPDWRFTLGPLLGSTNMPTKRT